MCAALYHKFRSLLQSDATAVAREVFNTDLIKGEWVGENMLKTITCAPVKINLTSSPTGDCYKFLPVKIEWFNQTEIFGFIDPRHSIVSKNSEKGQCEMYRYQNIYYDEVLYSIDQITGKRSKIPYKIFNLEKANELNIHPTHLLIFENLILSNFSDDELKLFQHSGPMHIAQLLERDYEQNGPAEILLQSPGPFSISFPSISFEYVLNIYIKLFVIAFSVHLLEKFIGPKIFTHFEKRARRKKSSVQKTEASQKEEHSDSRDEFELRVIDVPKTQ
jgi:hypothetical protein